jgi:DNA-binding SARP family transcriptional activator/nucleotide-binding universal stress UspA family protein
MVDVHFGILGPLEVRDGDSPLPIVGAGLRGLLVVLLLNANEVVSIDRLMDALWPGEPPPSGTAALQVRVSHLRKALGTGASAVVTRPPGYVVELGRGELDLYRFEDLLTRAEDAEPSDAAGLLREALGLWRGSPLADVAYETFAQPAIARLAELRLATLERRIDADLALGRHAELVGEIAALVVEHPLRERMRGQHMLALYRSGRQADALRSFQEARSALVDALGLEPGPVIRQLELAMLRQDPSLQLAEPETPNRSLLVVTAGGDDLEALAALAGPLARRPSRELILAGLVSSKEDLGPVSDRLRQCQKQLAADGSVTRIACFTAADRGKATVRLAVDQDADLLVIHGPDALLDDPAVRTILSEAPCDVGVLIDRSGVSSGPVVVPFGGGEHDWTAIEIGAWFAGALDVPLRLAGPREDGRDASRLLASASLATQRAFGVIADPVLLEPSATALVATAADAALVVVGLSDRWQRDGLGSVREALAVSARPTVLLVRGGIRPGGLAPRESLTRFTWSIRS